MFGFTKIALFFIVLTFLLPSQLRNLLIFIGFKFFKHTFIFYVFFDKISNDYALWLKIEWMPNQHFPFYLVLEKYKDLF